MKRKTMISGAMIVAAGVSASTDKVSAAKPETETGQPKITDAGLSLDMVKLDDDVLGLGGVNAHGAAFGADDVSGSHLDDENYFIAQTVFGGSGNDGVSSKGTVSIPGTKRLVVINPNTSKSLTVLHNSRTGDYFNPSNGAKISPPKWLRQQVEK